MDRLRVKKERDFWNAFCNRFVKSAIADTSVPLSDYLSTLEGHIKKGGVMELGCGIGRLTIPLALKFPDVAFTGVDISQKMLLFARKEAMIAGAKNITWLKNDGRSIKTKQRYDLIFSVTTFQHINELGVKQYFEAISKCIKKGGTFRFQFVEGTEQVEFSQQYTKLKIKKWLRKNGFEVVEMEQLLFPNWIFVTATKQ